MRTGKSATLNDIAVFSGEELVRIYGPGVRQQLVDLAMEAIRKADDGEIEAIDRRMREVDHYLAQARGLIPKK